MKKRERKREREGERQIEINQINTIDIFSLFKKNIIIINNFFSFLNHLPLVLLPA